MKPQIEKLIYEHETKSFIYNGNVFLLKKIEFRHLSTN